MLKTTIFWNNYITPPVQTHGVRLIIIKNKIPMRNGKDKKTILDTGKRDTDKLRRNATRTRNTLINHLHQLKWSEKAHYDTKTIDEMFPMFHKNELCTTPDQEYKKEFLDQLRSEFKITHDSTKSIYEFSRISPTVQTHGVRLK